MLVVHFCVLGCRVHKLLHTHLHVTVGRALSSLPFMTVPAARLQNKQLKQCVKQLYCLLSATQKVNATQGFTCVSGCLIMLIVS